ncbi:MAG: cyclic nucleotide-binding domain-containing protein, partial [Spirochaetia bacterium]|nr:cyclic nucleotide-binding domain-containing protein [Spirochaetia bacterium]
MADPLFEKFGVTKKRGDIVFCEYEPGSTLFFIQTGMIRITKIVNNREKTMAILPPGEIFGEMAILEEAPRSATAIVEEDARMLELDKESFAQLVTAQPAIAMKLLRIFSTRITDQKRKIKILALPDNEAKVMDVFLMLAEKKNINVEEV